jgi:hypothetical protein
MRPWTGIPLRWKRSEIGDLGLLVRRFVLPTSLADRTANQRAQKATSDRLSSSSSSSSNPATRSDGVLEYGANLELHPASGGVGSACSATE